LCYIFTFGGIHSAIMLIMVKNPEALRLFWSKMEAVVELELNLDQGNFTGRNQRLLIYWVLIMKERSYSGANQKRSDADYHKEFIGCCSTGAECGEWRLFWKKVEDVPILQLNMKHRSFSSMEAVVEGIGGCCSTGAVSKTCKHFFGRNSFRINAGYDSETSYDKESRINGSYNSETSNANYNRESRHYYCCFGGCCSTGTESEALKLLWRELKDVAILQGCGSLELNLKRVNSFLLEEILLRINASYNKESSHYYRCFGGCYSTEAEAGEWRLFWKKLEDIPILQLSLKHGNSSCYNNESSREAVVGGIGDCCSTGAESEVWMLFWSELKNVALLEMNLKRLNFFLRGIHLESMLVTIKNPGCCLTIAESKIRNGGFFCFRRNSHLAIILITIENPDVFFLSFFAALQFRHDCYCFGGCYSTGTHGSSFVKDSFNDNANFDKEHGHYYCCFGGCYSTGTESKALMLFWKRSGGCYLIGTKTGEQLFWNELDLILEETGDCYSTEYGAWKLIWKELEVVALLEFSQNLGCLFSVSSFIISLCNLRLDFFLRI
uniref:Uncharacterized protein n=1 Tax=Strongyloides stercoralis TaxID=6248 RepID=A0AAF5CY97_STRER